MKTFSASTIFGAFLFKHFREHRSAKKAVSRYHPALFCWVNSDIKKPILIKTGCFFILAYAYLISKFSWLPLLGIPNTYMPALRSAGIVSADDTTVPVATCFPLTSVKV